MNNKKLILQLFEYLKIKKNRPISRIFLWTNFPDNPDGLLWQGDLNLNELLDIGDIIELPDNLVITGNLYGFWEGENDMLSQNLHIKGNLDFTSIDNVITKKDMQSLPKGLRIDGNFILGDIEFEVPKHVTVRGKIIRN